LIRELAALLLREMTERNHGKFVKANFWHRNRSRERGIPSIGCS
jgi:hypothetical protein